MHSNHGTVISYTIGFILSIVLTLIAPTLILIHDASGHVIFTHPFLRIAAVMLAIVQIFVQFIFFLHVHKGTSRRSNLIALSFTALILAIIVGGSIWIMNHLNENMMVMPDTSNTQQYLIDQ